jgi:hypothetical protein
MSMPMVCTLMPALATRVEDQLGRPDTKPGWALEADPDADDGQCLLFRYPGAFPRPGFQGCALILC